jgi:hypothetical protein
MRYFVLSFLLFVILTELNAQNSDNAFTQIPQLIHIDTSFLSVVKSVSGSTKSIPPHYFYMVYGYKYQIILYLHLSDSIRMMDTSLYLISAASSGANGQAIRIYSNRMVKISSQDYQYSLPIVVKKEDTTDFVIISLTDKGLIMKILTDHSYFSRSTNKQSIYFFISTN